MYKAAFCAAFFANHIAFVTKSCYTVCEINSLAGACHMHRLKREAGVRPAQDRYCERRQHFGASDMPLASAGKVDASARARRPARTYMTGTCGIRATLPATTYGRGIWVCVMLCANPIFLILGGKMNENYISQLKSAVREIMPLNASAMEAARARQDSLAKPPHSLGRLEDISVRMAGITGKVMNRADKRQILIFSSDNGVVAEGVASAPQSVTLSQTINFARGLTGVATLARHYNTPIRVIDVGVNADFSYPGVENRKIAMGTRNIAFGPAMSRDQALQAICTGIECARDAAGDGVEILGVGEMGIGNTTTSSAILACLTGLEPEKVVGRGGGVNDQGFRRKLEIIRDALTREKPDPADPIDVIAKVGGFDIAAMAGAFIGAAAVRLPVVIDGFISAVAALCAARIAPGCQQYMFASHASYEIGYSRAMEALGLKPMFDLEMRLGEGSGCPIAFGIISAALAVICEMGTFADAEICDDYLDEIRADERLQR